MRITWSIWLGFFFFICRCLYTCWQFSLCYARIWSIPMYQAKLLGFNFLMLFLYRILQIHLFDTIFFKNTPCAFKFFYCFFSLFQPEPEIVLIYLFFYNLNWIFSDIIPRLFDSYNLIYIVTLNEISRENIKLVCFNFKRFICKINECPFIFITIFVSLRLSSKLKFFHQFLERVVFY